MHVFKLTVFVHWLFGQYSWSMITGLLTFCMIIPSKCILVALPLLEAGQLFTLTPFKVPEMVQSVTKIPSTGSSLSYLPRLPTLIPWPGPHVTLLILTCLAPSPIEMQSSPVPMFESVMTTPVECPMWIPSVLGLSPGAVIVKCWNVILLHPKRFTWNSLLFKEVRSRMTVLLTKFKLKVCNFKLKKAQQSDY